MERILDLIRNSELLRVELVSLGLILLVFLINFFIKVGHKMFICGAILILVPAIWFGIIKMIIKLISHIRVPEEAWPWIWGSLAIILLLVILFIFRKRIVGIKRPKVARWWLVIPLLAIGIWGYKQYQISRLLNGQPNKISPTAIYDGPAETTAPTTYQKLNTNGENIMKKGETKQFTFSYDGPTYYFSPKGSDTVLLSFRGNGTSWERRLWRDKDGVVQRKLIGTRPPAFAGTCLVSADKETVVVVEEKVE